MSFANLYRPQSLDETIGHSIVIDIIKSSALRDKLSSVILFTGPHGTGKTSLARIVAKIFNCKKITDGYKVCCKCEDCIAIASGSHVDVLEIDAASNTGVEDVRTIINNSIYSPVKGKNKVYIIDEVHMLSNNAFNALLKILEEPPVRAKFILATTEKSKIPLTVLSRCQSLQLRKLTMGEIEKKILNIAFDIKMNIDKQAVSYIAYHSAGSMRDALFLLEQLFALFFNEKFIDLSMVACALGRVSTQSAIELADSIFSLNLRNIVNIVNDANLEGKNLFTLCESIIDIINCVFMVSIFGPSCESMFEEEFSIFERSELDMIKKISSQNSIHTVNRVLQILCNGINDLKSSEFKLYQTRTLLSTASLLGSMNSIKNESLINCDLSAQDSNIEDVLDKKEIDDTSDKNMGKRHQSLPLNKFSENDPYISKVKAIYSVMNKSDSEPLRAKLLYFVNIGNKNSKVLEFLRSSFDSCDIKYVSEALSGSFEIELLSDEQKYKLDKDASFISVMRYCQKYKSFIFEKNSSFKGACDLLGIDCDDIDIINI